MCMLCSQLENGILLPSLRPMLPLLDLHGVRRLDFHTSVLEELREKLVSHINELGAKEGRERDKKLKELLAKSTVFFFYNKNNKCIHPY